MAVDLKKMGKQYDDYKNRKPTSASTFSIEANKKRWVIMCPPHKNMDGIPYVQNMYHTRDLPKDVKGANFSIGCQRLNFEDTNFKKCWPCGRMLVMRKKKVEKGDEFDEKARTYSPKIKAMAQVIDVTPCMNKENEIRKPLKKCFGRYNKEDNCEDCFLAEVCEKFIQKWYMPQRCWERFNEHFKDYGDITDMNKMVPVRITRTGKGQFDTRYDTEVFPKNKMVLPEKLQKRIEKSLLDLTKEDPKPTGTEEELKKIYKDFYEFTDIQSADDDDDDDDDGSKEEKREKKNKKEKRNKKDKKRHAHKEENDKLREDMKRRARKGKLDRE